MLLVLIEEVLLMSVVGGYCKVADDSSRTSPRVEGELVLLTAHGIARCVRRGGRRRSRRGRRQARAGGGAGTEAWGLQSKWRSGGGGAAGRCDIELTVVGGGGGDGGGGDGGGDGVAVPDGREASHSLSVTAVSHSGGLHPALSVPGLDQKHMDFFDYGTESFAKVRAALGINATDYAASFTAVQSLLSSCANQHERSAGLREIVSSGASGQFFYFTPDRRFVVKTLSRHEKRALLSLAPYYASHCEAHPDTLIRYLGMHSIRLPLNTCKVYFVVMANVLPPQKPQLTFDLKGATSNRQRVRGKALTELITGRRAASTFPTLLDKDWLHLSLRLQFTVTSEADALAATLAADSSFLASQGLMDYSLLLGIRTAAKAEEAKAEEAAAARRRRKRRRRWRTSTATHDTTTCRTAVSPI